MTSSTQSEGTPRHPSWRGWRNAVRRWGPEGNERLTTSIGLVLLVLLAVEALTTVSVRSFLRVHVFLGLLLLPPIALKLGSTGWRFMRYYARSNAYRLNGPPNLLLRLLAPLLVLSTLTLFGTGVALVVVGSGEGLLRGLHGASFLVWGFLMIAHVLAYFVRTLRVGSEDWRRRAEVVAGAGSRRLAVAGALLAGVILAVGAYSFQPTWFQRGHDDRGGAESIGVRR